jgi:hypothetical protein
VPGFDAARGRATVSFEAAIAHGPDPALVAATIARVAARGLLEAVGDRRAVLGHLVAGAQDPGLRAELAAVLQEPRQDSDGEGR